MQTCHTNPAISCESWLWRGSAFYLMIHPVIEMKAGLMHSSFTRCGGGFKTKDFKDQTPRPRTSRFVNRIQDFLCWRRTVWKGTLYTKRFATINEYLLHLCYIPVFFLNEKREKKRDASCRRIQPLWNLCVQSCQKQELKIQLVENIVPICKKINLNSFSLYHQAIQNPTCLQRQATWRAEAQWLHVSAGCKYPAGRSPFDAQHFQSSFECLNMKSLR